MSIDPDDSVLEQALRSDLPPADAKERVRRRLLAAGVAVGNGMAATTSAAAAGTAATGVFAKAMGASWGIKLGFAAAITIPSVGLLVEAQKPQVVVPAPPPTALDRAEAVPSVAERPAVAPVATATAPAGVMPIQPTRAAAPQAPRVATVAPEAVEPSQDEFAPPSVVAPEPAKVSSTLAEETRLLDGAFAALAVGDRLRAAELISEHEAKFPAGMLQKERRRAKDKLSETSRGE